VVNGTINLALSTLKVVWPGSSYDYYSVMEYYVVGVYTPPASTCQDESKDVTCVVRRHRSDALL